MAALKQAGLIAGRYRIERFLGKGGMSEVWLAEDEHIGRRVAVKFLQPSVAGSGDLDRETAILSSLRHPNIVTVYDAGEDDGRRFIVMEHVEGRSLRERLREGPVDVQEAARIGAAIAGALAHAHAHGVLHNDVKPENVLFDSEGALRLTDFGIAHLTGETLAPTQSLEIMGTLPYVAPEVLQGSSPGPGADVYSLAVTLYETVTGRLPFDGPSNAAVLGQKLSASLPREDEMAHLPPAFRDAIMAGMSLAPANRPHAAALERALANVADGSRGRLAATPWQPISSSHQMATERLAPMRFAYVPSRRRGAVLGLATLVGLGLLFAGAVALPWERKGTSPTPTVVSKAAGAPTATASPTAQVRSQATPSPEGDRADAKGKGKGRGNKHVD